MVPKTLSIKILRCVPTLSSISPKTLQLNDTTKDPAISSGRRKSVCSMSFSTLTQLRTYSVSCPGQSIDFNLIFLRSEPKFLKIEIFGVSRSPKSFDENVSDEFLNFNSTKSGQVNFVQSLLSLSSSSILYTVCQELKSFKPFCWKKFKHFERAYVNCLGSQAILVKTNSTNLQIDGSFYQKTFYGVAEIITQFWKQLTIAPKISNDQMVFMNDSSSKKGPESGGAGAKDGGAPCPDQKLGNSPPPDSNKDLDKTRKSDSGNESASQPSDKSRSSEKLRDSLEVLLSDKSTSFESVQSDTSSEEKSFPKEVPIFTEEVLWDALPEEVEMGFEEEMSERHRIQDARWYPKQQQPVPTDVKYYPKIYYEEVTTYEPSMAMSPEQPQAGPSTNFQIFQDPEVSGMGVESPRHWSQISYDMPPSPIPVSGPARFNPMNQYDTPPCFANRTPDSAGRTTRVRRRIEFDSPSGSGDGSGSFASTPINQGPYTSTPIQHGPTTSTPIHRGPHASTPIQHGPITSTPIHREPYASTPIQHGPTTSTPIHHGPYTSTPFQQGPTTSTPIHHGPYTSTPFQHGPTTSTPIHSGPYTSSPIQQGYYTSSPTPNQQLPTARIRRRIFSETSDINDSPMVNPSSFKVRNSCDPCSSRSRSSTSRTPPNTSKQSPSNGFTFSPEQVPAWRPGNSFVVSSDEGSGNASRLNRFQFTAGPAVPTRRPGDPFVFSDDEDTNAVPDPFVFSDNEDTNTESAPTLMQVRQTVTTCHNCDTCSEEIRETSIRKRVFPNDGSIPVGTPVIKSQIMKSIAAVEDSSDESSEECPRKGNLSTTSSSRVHSGSCPSTSEGKKKTSMTERDLRLKHSDFRKDKAVSGPDSGKSASHGLNNCKDDGTLLMQTKDSEHKSIPLGGLSSLCISPTQLNMDPENRDTNTFLTSKEEEKQKQKQLVVTPNFEKSDTSTKHKREEYKAAQSVYNSEFDKRIDMVPIRKNIMTNKLLQSVVAPDLRKSGSFVISSEGGDSSPRSVENPDLEMSTLLTSSENKEDKPLTNESLEITLTKSDRRPTIHAVKSDNQLSRQIDLFEINDRKRNSSFRPLLDSSSFILYHFNVAPIKCETVFNQLDKNKTSIILTNFFPNCHVKLKEKLIQCRFHNYTANYPLTICLLDLQPQLAY